MAGNLRKGGMPEPGETSQVDDIIVEAIIDYIATTPENINYNMLREMLRALINKEDHPYFQYYMDKMGSKKDEEAIPGEIPGETSSDLDHLD